MKSSPSLNLINLTDIMGKSNLINCVSYLNWDYRSSSSHVFIINAETTTCDVLPPSIPVSSSLLEPEPIPRSTDTNRAVAVVLYALRRDDSSFPWKAFPFRDYAVCTSDASALGCIAGWLVSGSSTNLLCFVGKVQHVLFSSPFLNYSYGWHGFLWIGMSVGRSA